MRPWGRVFHIIQQSRIEDRFLQPAPIGGIIVVDRHRHPHVVVALFVVGYFAGLQGLQG